MKAGLILVLERREAFRGLAESLEQINVVKDSVAVNKLKQIQAELKELSRPELEQLRERLDELLEDQLQFTPEFEAAIEQSEREMGEGVQPRVRRL